MYSGFDYSFIYWVIVVERLMGGVTVGEPAERENACLGILQRVSVVERLMGVVTVGEPAERENVCLGIFQIYFIVFFQGCLEASKLQRQTSE